MSKAIQRVVRTGVNQISSYECRHNMDDLEHRLEEGYTVVMCNKIARGGEEWLEYILQKEINEQTELEDVYDRGYKAGSKDKYREIASEYMLLTEKRIAEIESERESFGITRALDILESLDKRIFEKVKDKLYEQDYNEQKEQKE